MAVPFVPGYRRFLSVFLAGVALLFACLVSAAGANAGSLLTTASSTPLCFYVSDIAVPLQPSQRSRNLGSVSIGSRKIVRETLTNASNTSLTISRAEISGAGFAFSGLSLPVTLPPGHSYTFSVSFAPKSSGSVTGSLSLLSSTGNPAMTIHLSGQGTAAGSLSLGVSSLDFGAVGVGSSRSLAGTLTTNGSSVTISSATLNSSEFSLVGVSFPLTIAAGEKVPFTVKFTPQMGGTASAGIVFNGDASSSSSAQNLTGEGAVTSQHRVTLSWHAGHRSAMGYNVYRSNSSNGPFSKIDFVPGSTTSYVDRSVQSGRTYYYATTAVGRNGKESKHSNHAQAVIP
jgi:Abnormal spindle-like microcephaly-assoc'd, ASPM-SPD-2-Hydin